MTFYERMKRFTCKVVPARLWKNFGRVRPSVYRSGQFEFIRLFFTLLIIRPRIVIALNTDPSDKWWHKNRIEQWMVPLFNITHLMYSWSAGGPRSERESGNWEEVNHVIEIIENCFKKNTKVLIHCAGGKDRTGGAIGLWGARYNRIPFEEFFPEQCSIYNVPGIGWIDPIRDEYDQHRR